MTEYVLSQGDIAIATLRKPEVLSNLTAEYSQDKLLVLKLDVKESKQILDAFVKAKEVFGRIDVVYNNAGYGTYLSQKTLLLLFIDWYCMTQDGLGRLKGHQ